MMAKFKNKIVDPFTFLAGEELRGQAQKFNQKPREKELKLELGAKCGISSETAKKGIVRRWAELHELHPALKEGDFLQGSKLLVKKCEIRRQQKVSHASAQHGANKFRLCGTPDPAFCFLESRPTENQEIKLEKKVEIPEMPQGPIKLKEATLEVKAPYTGDISEKVYRKLEEKTEIERSEWRKENLCAVVNTSEDKVEGLKEALKSISGQVQINKQGEG